MKIADTETPGEATHGAAPASLGLASSLVSSYLIALVREGSADMTQIHAINSPDDGSMAHATICLTIGSDVLTLVTTDRNTADAFTAAHLSRWEGDAF